MIMASQEDKLFAAKQESKKGEICLERGEIEDALLHFERASAQYEALGLPIVVGWLHLAQGDAWKKAGKFSKAKSHYQKAIVIFESLGELHGAVVADSKLAEEAKRSGSLKMQRFHEKKRAENLAKLGVAWAKDIDFQVVLEELDRRQDFAFGKGVNYRGAPR